LLAFLSHEEEVRCHGRPNGEGGKTLGLLIFY